MPPISEIDGVPGPVGCGGGGEETGGLPEPSPPQPNEKTLAVIATNARQAAGRDELTKNKIRDIENDMRDMDLSSLDCLLYALCAC
jgi:hypothetical protein